MLSCFSVGPLVRRITFIVVLGLQHTLSQWFARLSTRMVSFTPSDPETLLPLLPHCSDKEAEALGGEATRSRSLTGKRQNWDSNPGQSDSTACDFNFSVMV